MFDCEIPISIVMTSYNYERFISDAINSVISQTYKNWELIIVDDGSQDNSISIIEEYIKKDSRIKLFCHEKRVNKGLKESLLLGLKNAVNDWIVFLESDDMITSDYLSVKTDIISQNPSLDLIFNDIECIGNQSVIDNLNIYFQKREEMLAKKRIPFYLFCENNIIPTFSCVMVKKSVIETCDFESIIPQNLDWHLWSQLINSANFAYTEKKLTLWRKHSNNYMNHLSLSNVNKFSGQIISNMSNGFLKKILIDFYVFINQTKIEKLLRYQVRALSSLLLKFIFMNKYFSIEKY